MAMSLETLRRSLKSSMSARVKSEVVVAEAGAVFQFWRVVCCERDIFRGKVVFRSCALYLYGPGVGSLTQEKRPAFLSSRMVVGRGAVGNSSSVVANGLGENVD